MKTLQLLTGSGDDEEAEVGARGRMSEGYSYRDSAPGLLPPAESTREGTQA